MKNLILLFAFAMTAGLVSAQEVATKKACSKAEKAACAKTCTKAEKAACAAKKAAGTAGLVEAVEDVEVTQESEANASNVLSASAAADILAEADESITRKECSASGKVSYFQESVCAKSGKVSMNEVKYCSKSEAFVSAEGDANSAGAATKSCSKSKKACSKSKAACSKKSSASVDTDATDVLSASAAADLLAESDESISRKECAMSGKVSYFQKSECAKSGKISMNEVKYCSDSKAFVNASPSEVMSDQEAKVIKTADTVDGKVQSVKSSGKKKACCKGKKKCGSKKAGA